MPLVQYCVAGKAHLDLGKQSFFQFLTENATDVMGRGTYGLSFFFDPIAVPAKMPKCIVEAWLDEHMPPISCYISFTQNMKSLQRLVGMKWQLAPESSTITNSFCFCGGRS
eukprot:1853105-Rhodomonas_salina.1